MNSGLFDELKKYGEGDFYPFHMPGHKRNPASGSLSEFYRYDITEIDGFDNLHQPCGIIKEAQERAARLYHSEETYFLVNGSTAGILSAVSAVTERANKLIIARNCHKAVYHAAFLKRLELHYLYPTIIEDYDMAGAVTAEELERVIHEILVKEQTDEQHLSEFVGGVVVTSPTYEGIVSDIRALSEICHRYKLPLIVDQAHGAHFGMHPDFPENAVTQGADLVIHSTHKTLPAPTQTALLHRNGILVRPECIQRYLRIYQSSSPSYLLMAGIDEAMGIASKEGKNRLENLLALRNDFMKKMRVCHGIRICPYTEPGKLVISVKGSKMTGQQLYDLLRERYHLQMEMAAGSYVVAILTMMDTKEGFERLLAALLEIDHLICLNAPKEAMYKEACWSNKPVLWETIFQRDFLEEQEGRTPVGIYEAYTAEKHSLPLEKAQGKIAGEFVNLYPPGIPLIVPGERITRDLLDMIGEYLRKGYFVQGISEDQITVIRL